MPWLGLLFAGFSPRRHVFNFRPAHVGFVVDKMIRDRFFWKYFGFPLVASLQL
jgi:hypothetical protein